MILQQTVATVIKARGLDVKTVSERAGIPEDLLKRAVIGKAELTDMQIRGIADELAVPVSAFFAKQQPDLFPIVDFRRTNPRISKVSKGTLQAISFVESFSNTFSSIGMKFDVDSSAKKVSSQFAASDAIELARVWRTKWGLTTQDQLNFGSANGVYKSLREFLEGLGVAIIHHSFRDGEVGGIYMQVGEGPHTIVINTTQSSKARKLFTLAHEFCHFLLRLSGVSNPSIIKNDIENFCNKFAANLLAPKDLIFHAMRRYGYSASTENDQVRIFAKRLGISQEALLIRFVELDFISTSQYSQWKSQFHSFVPEGDMSDGAGGGSSDPIQNKKTEFGSTLISAFTAAVKKGWLDEVDVYRISGLKPKYQNQLFDVG